jgi:8-oxo-dGTP diphosphatase
MTTHGKVLKAGGVVLRKDRMICIVQDAESHGWILPKGKVEEGESTKQAGVREIREECGVVAHPVSLIYIWEGDHSITYYYLMRGSVDIGATIDRHEIEAIRWASYEDCLENLRERDRKILKCAWNIVYQVDTKKGSYAAACNRTPLSNPTHTRAKGCSGSYE